ncbi:MAG: T9SS type A sorting domain-containing protein [Ignavibacteria bacterium]
MKKLLLILLFTISLFHTSLFAQWQKQTIPVNKPISGIKFIDSLKGWACTSISIVNDTSYIINTTNGGSNWSIQYKAYGTTFTCIAAITSNILYVGGYDASNNIDQLLKSSNGGMNWINLGPPSIPSDLFFVNQDSGWYCADFIGPDVRTTTDGGTTWQLRNSGLTDNINRLFFLNYSTGWAGSRYFKKTTNAGLNWVQIYDFATESIYSMYFTNEQTGWAALSGAKIGKTTNGGVNWIIQQPSITSNNTTDIYMVNDTGWAGTSLLYKVFKTVNGGLNWGQQSDTSGSIRISVINSNLAWSGSIGISKTTNGGGPIFYTGFTPEGTNYPTDFILYQNYPNPFNPYTTIKIDVSKDMPVTLYISDILGRMKYEIINQQLKPGTYTFNWDSGNYSSGVYFYTLLAGSIRQTRKMLLVK